MYHNLAIDVSGNMALVFTWEGEERTNVNFTLLGEDPASGNPVIFSWGPYADLDVAARAAWNWITRGDYFDIYQFSGEAASIVTSWGRAYGTNFSLACKVATAEDRQVSGVVLSSWSSRIKLPRA